MTRETRLLLAATLASALVAAFGWVVQRPPVTDPHLVGTPVMRTASVDPTTSAPLRGIARLRAAVARAAECGVDLGPLAALLDPVIERGEDDLETEVWASILEEELARKCPYRFRAGGYVVGSPVPPTAQ